MLVLSRKKNQRIRFGEDIVLTVIEIRGDKARLGIVAPSHIAIHRDEVYNAIKASGCEREPKSPSVPNSLEDKAAFTLLDLLTNNGYRITDEIRTIVAQCSQDFSSLMFLVKGQANAAS